MMTHLSEHLWQSSRLSRCKVSMVCIRRASIATLRVNCPYYHCYNPTANPTTATMTPISPFWTYATPVAADDGLTAFPALPALGVELADDELAGELLCEGATLIDDEGAEDEVDAAPDGDTDEAEAEGAREVVTTSSCPLMYWSNVGYTISFSSYGCVLLNAVAIGIRCEKAALS